jgi:hypothetical protein
MEQPRRLTPCEAGRDDPALAAAAGDRGRPAAAPRLPRPRNRLRPGAAARAIASRLDRGHILAIDRSAKAVGQARAAAVDEIASGRMTVRQIAAEDFELQPYEAPYDLVLAVRVGALDGPHPNAGARVLWRIAQATTANARLFIDGGNPLRELPIPPRWINQSSESQEPIDVRSFDVTQCLCASSLECRGRIERWRDRSAPSRARESGAGQVGHPGRDRVQAWPGELAGWMALVVDFERARVGRADGPPGGFGAGRRVLGPVSGRAVRWWGRGRAAAGAGG